MSSSIDFRHMHRAACRLGPVRGVLFLALLATAGCTPPIRQFDLKDQPLSCDEANRLTYRTVEAMRFKVSEFQPAPAGGQGVIKASRTSGSDNRVQAITVRLECTPTGVTIDASEDGAWLTPIEFKRAFHHAFLNVMTMHASRQQLEEQVLAGTAPASQQRRDLRIVVEPVRGQSARLDFPFDLAAGGVLPVRVAITNLTAHVYAIDPTAIRLVRADGERVVALTPDAAAQRMAAAPAATAPDRPPLPSPAAVRDALALRELTAARLAPGSERTGFLYFPLAEYRSARVVVTDTETGEDEGVRVEF